MEKGWPRDPGSLWRQKLAELWRDDTLTLKEVQKRLQVGPQTLKRQALKAQLPLPRFGGGFVTTAPLDRRGASKPFNTRVARREQRAALQESKRAEWLALRATHPKCGMAELRRIDRQDLSKWLRRYDHEWLMAHRPPRKPRGSAPRTDWHGIDLRLAGLVRPTVTKLRTSSAQPQRLTCTAIAREMGEVLRISSSKAKLPLTMQAIETAVETVEQIAIRRIGWAQRSFLLEGSTPVLRLFLGRAGVAYRQLASKAIGHAVAMALADLESELTPGKGSQ